MRRVLVFLEWKREWWLERQSLREGLTPALAEGITAFAIGQANLQRSLATHFREIWKGSVRHGNLANTNTPGNDLNNPEEEDDDSDEDEDQEHEGEGEEEEGDD